MAAAAARLRKTALLETARRVLTEPSLVAVGALTHADAPSGAEADSLKYREFAHKLLAAPRRPSRKPAVEESRLLESPRVEAIT